MVKKNSVQLKAQERKYLQNLVRKGKEKARKLTRCRILLLSDGGKNDTSIINALQVSRNTIRQVRKRYATADIEAAINERQRPGGTPKV